MILDNLLMFTGTSNGTSGGITSGPQTDAPTTGAIFATNILDLGVNSGVPTSANGGGGRDLGIGDDPALELLILCTAAFAGGTSIAFALEGAPDNGSGAPGAYTRMWLSPVYALAALAAAGVQLANVTVPRTIPGQPLPRFLRLAYVIVGTFTGGGSVEAGIVLDRDDQIYGGSLGQGYGGYPAGITVAN